jgi:hypothetical protein
MAGDSSIGLASQRPLVRWLGSGSRGRLGRNILEPDALAVA